MSVLDSKSNGIDAVYTWVNGSDAGYLQECQKYAKKPIDLNPERYRDEYQLLKYSLRSLELYVPWVRNVYLFTKRPQVPDWLDTTHPRLKIVHHDQVIDPLYLPTFNPNTIESFLHKIPGLSEQFLYVNDDFLFGRQTNREDFVSREGIINVFGTLAGENLGFRVYDSKNDIIGLGLIEHCPLLITKADWEACAALRPEAMHATRSHKFRQPGDFMMYKLYRYYMLRHQRQRCRPVKLWELNKVHCFHKITNSFGKQLRGIEKIEKLRPKFFCMNDDQRDSPNPEVVALIKDFLRRNYPEPSSFEKS